MSTHLMEVKVTIVNTTECEKNYKDHRERALIDNSVICAGDGTHDSCRR